MSGTRPRPTTIGILGGMSPASTVYYYRELNRLAGEHVGPGHTAPLLIRSVDFAAMKALQAAGDWDTIGDILTGEALALERAGAGLILLATNTMHRVADAITGPLSVPFLHIADALAGALVADGRRAPALLGTRYTMEEGFYRDHLTARGLDVRVPDAAARDMVHRVIFDELVFDRIREDSRAAFLALIGELKAAGADSVILGCTEIGLLVEAGAAPLPAYDTARLHCAAAMVHACR